MLTSSSASKFKLVSKEARRLSGLGSFAHAVENICYWLTMLVLAVLTVYLAYLTVGHAPPPEAAGIGSILTPRWLFDCVPLFIAGVCLGQAGYCFWQGTRSWKELAVSAGILLFRGFIQWGPRIGGALHW